jgi:hypothetical protein
MYSGLIFLLLLWIISTNGEINSFL